MIGSRLFWRILTVSILTGAYLLAACSGGGGSATSSPVLNPLTGSSTSSPVLSPSTASPIAGYTSFHSARFGYSIQIPSDWNAEPSFSFAYQGQTLYADLFRGPEESNFTTNLNINGGPTNGTSREEMYAQDIASAKSSHNDTRVADIELLGQPAKRLTYTAGSLTNQAPFDQQQIIVVYADKEWILTLSTALGKLDLYQGTFETVAGTFAPD